MLAVPVWLPVLDDDCEREPVGLRVPEPLGVPTCERVRVELRVPEVLLL